MKLDNVSKSFAGRRVLNNLTYEFSKGITAITGPSGVGKSTLTGIMAGLIKPDAGYVLRGEGKMSIVFQEDRLIEYLTAIQNLCFAAGKSAPGCDSARTGGKARSAYNGRAVSRPRRSRARKRGAAHLQSRHTYYNIRDA